MQVDSKLIDNNNNHIQSQNEVDQAYMEARSKLSELKCHLQDLSHVVSDCKCTTASSSLSDDVAIHKSLSISSSSSSAVTSTSQMTSSTYPDNQLLNINNNNNTTMNNHGNRSFWNKKITSEKEKWRLPMKQQQQSQLQSLNRGSLLSNNMIGGGRGGGRGGTCPCSLSSDLEDIVCNMEEKLNSMSNMSNGNTVVVNKETREIGMSKNKKNEIYNEVEVEVEPECDPESEKEEIMSGDELRIENNLESNKRLVMIRSPFEMNENMMNLSENWILYWMKNYCTWFIKDKNEFQHDNNIKASAIASAVRQAVFGICKNSYKNMAKTLLNSIATLLDTEARHFIHSEMCWLSGTALKCITCNLPFVFTVHSRTAIGHPCIDEHANITAEITCINTQEWNENDEYARDILESDDNAAYLEFTPDESGLCDISPHHQKSFYDAVPIESIANVDDDDDVDDDDIAPSTFRFKDTTPTTLNTSQNSSDTFSFAAASLNKNDNVSRHQKMMDEAKEECMGTADLSVFIRKGKEDKTNMSDPLSCSAFKLVTGIGNTSPLSSSLTSLMKSPLASSSSSTSSNMNMTESSKLLRDHVELSGIDKYFKMNGRNLIFQDCTKNEKIPGKRIKLKNTYYEIEYNENNVIGRLRLDSRFNISDSRPSSRLSYTYSESEIENSEFEHVLESPRSIASDIEQVNLKKAHSMQNEDSLANTLEKVDLLRSASFRGFLGNNDVPGENRSINHRRRRQESISNKIKKFQLDNNFIENFEAEKKENSKNINNEIEGDEEDEDEEEEKVPPREVSTKKMKKLKSIKKFVKRVKKMMMIPGESSKVENNVKNKNNEEIKKSEMILKKREDKSNVSKKGKKHNKIIDELNHDYPSCIPILKSNIENDVSTRLNTNDTQSPHSKKNYEHTMYNHKLNVKDMNGSTIMSSEPISRSQSLQLIPNIRYKLVNDDDYDEKKGKEMVLISDINSSNGQDDLSFENIMLRKCSSDLCIIKTQDDFSSGSFSKIKNETSKLQVKNLRDGTYLIFGHITQLGQYHINLKIAGKPMPSTPIQISAVDSKTVGNGISEIGPFHPHKDFVKYSNPALITSLTPHPSHPPCHSVSYDYERLSYAKGHPHIGNIDILFIIDTNTSMAMELTLLSGVINGMSSLVQEAALHQCLRMGIIAYKDYGVENDEQCILKKLDLTDNISRVSNFVMGLEASGSESFPKAMELALEEAVEGISWLPFSSRFIVWIGDGPPHGYQGLTPSQITQSELTYLQAKNKFDQVAMKVEDAIQEGKPSHEIANFDMQLSEALSNYKKISKYYDHYPNGVSGRIKWEESVERLSLLGVRMIAIGLRDAITQPESRSCLRTIAHVMNGMLLEVENLGGFMIDALVASLIEQSLDRQLLEEEVCDLILAYEDDLMRQSFEERQCTIIETMNQAAKKIHKLNIYPSTADMTANITTNTNLNSIHITSDSINNHNNNNKILSKENNITSSTLNEHKSIHYLDSNSSNGNISNNLGESKEYILGMECCRLDKESLSDILSGIRRKAEAVGVSIRKNFDSLESWCEAFLLLKDIDISQKRITQRDFATYLCSAISLRYVSVENCMYHEN